MVSNSISVVFVLYLALLGATFSTRAEKINVAAGKPVFLHCPQKTGKVSRMTWTYNGNFLVQKFSGNIFKGEKSVTYIIDDEETFSLQLPKAEPGQYICNVDGEKTAYDVEVWKVTGSKSGYLLQGDTLKLHLSPAKDTRIEWFEPRKTKVTGYEPRWELQKNTLKISNLTLQEDDGIWECRVFPYKVNLSYNVKVLGFSNPLDELQFTAFNSSSNLSCSLNVDLQVKRDQEVPKLQSWKWLKNNILVKEHDVSNTSRSFSIYQLSNVRSEHAGRYRCQIGFKHGTLSKTINLIVVKVSATPPGLKSKDDNVTLCGHVSPSAPPRCELCWVYVNESATRAACGSPVPENKFCHVATTKGLWRFDLKVNNDVKISIDYVLGEFQGKTSNETTSENRLSLIKIASGIGAMLLLFILVGVCVPTCKRINQKQQQAKRMAQIKQHLLAKRTCQCQRNLPNDYFHT